MTLMETLLSTLNHAENKRSKLAIKEFSKISSIMPDHSQLLNQLRHHPYHFALMLQCTLQECPLPRKTKQILNKKAQKIMDKFDSDIWG